MLLLTHVGRSSGRTRRTVLEVVETHGDDPVIVSGYGRTSDWFRNVEAHPEVDVDWAGDRFTAIARILGPVEAAETFERYLRHHPKAAAAIVNRLAVPLDGDPSIVAERLPVLVLQR
jgi:deazaflavin-dependent oxidoreductase (nitroreductase family)